MMTDRSNLAPVSGVAGVDAFPEAERIPHERAAHGDAFIDPYDWVRDKESAQVQRLVREENDYYQARTAGFDGLKQQLFKELKSRIDETDMSVPTRMDGYWYFVRTREGLQYGVQCRLPIAGPDDWDPPQINVDDAPGAIPGEQVVFDPNVEGKGHDFFRLGGLDLSRDGRWLLYGVDTAGSERYDYHIRNLDDGHELPEVFEGIAEACLTPDGKWVFYTLVDESWRPFAVKRHRVGTPVADDVEVFHEGDARFWVGVGLSFDERNVVIGTSSKTTSEVLMLPVDQPEGEFRAFIARREGVEYDVSFACFEGAGADGSDIPLALVYHNAKNPNFEVDVVDLRSHEPPYALGEGTVVAVGSPYGCEQGDVVEAGASGKRVGTPYRNGDNPEILQDVRGLGIEGIAMYRHFVVLSYRRDGLPHVAVMTKRDAAEDFLAHRSWRFRELCAGETGFDERVEGGGQVGLPCGADSRDGEHLYSIAAGGNPSYDVPRLRYSFSSYTRPGELRELDVATGESKLLKRVKVHGGFDADNYREHRVWVRVRDAELVPVSLVWRADRCESMQRCADGVDAVDLLDSQAMQQSHGVPGAPMFITGYGAYEISSDPGFSVARLSMLDRGVLYAVAHVRGGGEMGRAWYEQGRRLAKRHTFEDFVDVTVALQKAGFADPSRTVANGGSAGGLLMGAVANMAPQCYAGIEADVPFVDALTSILDPSLPLTVTEWDEWGDPLHDKDVYDYMKSYSPYENAPFGPWGEPDGSAEVGRSNSERSGEIESVDMKDGGAARIFPKIFATTSMNDTRVLYVEPLKWVARLQSQGVDAIVRIEVEAGHGGISGRYKQWKEVSEENAWCLNVMGIDR